MDNLLITDFFNNIKQYSVHGIHYISIGCAYLENKCEIECSSGIYQQYPPFLKTSNNTIHKTLVLIDTILESFPKCLTLLDHGKWSNKEYKNVYKNKYYNMTVYCFNNSVSWMDEPDC